MESFWNRLGYAVIQGYGMTETTALISLNHPFRLGKGSIGKLFPGLEMKVGAGGEILVRGENIAAGYWRNKELQPVVEEDGWFHTGDLAEVDESGQLFFKGRQKNVIVTPAGMNIYPEDLERALREQAGVKDCVVLGNRTRWKCGAVRSPASGRSGHGSGAGRCGGESNRSRIFSGCGGGSSGRSRTFRGRRRRSRLCSAFAKRWSENSAETQRRRMQIRWRSLVARITGRRLSLVSAKSVLDQELNLSSLDRVELMGELEERYQVDLSDVKFSDATTIGQVEALLRNPPNAAVEIKYSALAAKLADHGVSDRRLLLVGVAGDLFAGGSAYSWARKSARSYRPCVGRFQSYDLRGHRMDIGGSAGKVSTPACDGHERRTDRDDAAAAAENGFPGTAQRAVELFSGVCAFQRVSVAEGIGISSQLCVCRRFGGPRMELADLSGRHHHA